MDFLRNFLRKREAPVRGAKPVNARQQQTLYSGKADTYKSGDVIGGRYQVREVLGIGGFGAVYLAFDHKQGTLCALKTFRDDLLTDVNARESFKKEAVAWVKLECHPFILAARWVLEFSGRLFVEMEYVAPDSVGRVHLGHHLNGHPMQTSQALKWSIQFCFGMEHANGHGIQCHRDIKPPNILIASDGAIRIGDFGLASGAQAAWGKRNGKGEPILSIRDNSEFGLSLIKSQGNTFCGTPGYIPPEVLRGEAWDRRSDIYSFGLVLWQMATGTLHPPFSVPWNGNIEDFLRANYAEQLRGHLPPPDSPLAPVIERCLRFSRSSRYQDFRQLRGALESVWRAETGTDFDGPRAGPSDFDLWLRKGASLAALGRHEEAEVCYDKALRLDPRSAVAWNNKGNALRMLGRYPEAIECLDRALAINPQEEAFWYNKGNVLNSMSRYQNAIQCYDRALVINPQAAPAWFNKGMALSSLGRWDEAITCFETASSILPNYALAINAKGCALGALGRHEEAVECYDKALKIDPLFAEAWFNKGVSEGTVSLTADTPELHQKQAKAAYLKAIAFAPAEKAQMVANAQHGIQVLETHPLFVMMRRNQPL